MSVVVSTPPTKKDVEALMVQFLTDSSEQHARLYLAAATDAWWAGHIDGPALRAHTDVLTTGLPHIEVKK